MNIYILTFLFFVSSNALAKLSGDPVLECITLDEENSFFLYMSDHDNYSFANDHGFHMVRLGSINTLEGELNSTKINLSFDEFGIGRASLKGEKKSNDSYFENVTFNYINIKDKYSIPTPKPIENLKLKCKLYL